MASNTLAASPPLFSICLMTCRVQRHTDTQTDRQQPDRHKEKERIARLHVMYMWVWVMCRCVHCSHHPELWEDHCHRWAPLHACSELQPWLHPWVCKRGRIRCTLRYEQPTEHMYCRLMNLSVLMLTPSIYYILLSPPPHPISPRCHNCHCMDEGRAFGISHCGSQHVHVHGM